jgi:DNA-binding transcriptional LysR family regulator
MDLRLLEYFVAVAELEHMGRAAERLSISQSPLSRQIKQLEQNLGLELFIREKQRIRLTPSGQWLLGQAKGLLDYAGKIQREAQQRASGSAGALTVGFVSPAMWSGILPRLLRRFKVEFPGIELQLRNMRSAAQVDAVVAGALDLGFISIPTGKTDIETKCIAEERFMLAIPAVHPLAKKRSITPRHLDGAPWIVLSRDVTRERYDRFLAACTSAGFTPVVVQEVSEPNTVLSLVEGGFGFALIQAGARHYAPRTVAFREVPWFTPKSRVYMIRPPQGRQPLSDLFARHIERVLARSDEGGRIAKTST